MSIAHRPAQKREAYKKVAADLDDFFSRYAVDTAGRSTMLQIGPYQGPVLATGLIPFGKGVCGTAAESRVTQIVADVSTCANYIPCDDVTRSEIVVPVWGHALHGEAGSEAPLPPASTDASGAKKLIAVLDIDSEELAAFDEVDQEALEALMAKWF